MPDTREPRTVIDAAEQAAAAGDYASAERLLREAASLQETSLGPLHPDLAYALNNLGVVCEITDKPDEAERCFRRAYEIATAVLEPSHAFVATSRKNLEDFCAARGVPVDIPTRPPLADVHVDAPAAPPAADVHVDAPAPPPAADVHVDAPAPPPAAYVHVDAPPTEAADVAPQRSIYEKPEPAVARISSRLLVIGAVIAGGLLVALLATPWFRANDAPESPPATPSASPVGDPPSTTAAAKPNEPKSTDVPKEITAKKSAPSRTEPQPESRTEAGPVSKPPLVVADVQLCRDLQSGGPASGEWRCDPPSRPVAQGRLLFYTRLKSPTDTTVQHRWYLGDRLRKAVDLTIRANTASGYRTYSRNTVGDAGEWRVELRTRDGFLLHEERFIVQ